MQTETGRINFDDDKGARLAWEDVSGNSDLDTSEWQGPSRTDGMRAITYHGHDEPSFDAIVAYLQRFPGAYKDMRPHKRGPRR